MCFAAPVAFVPGYPCRRLLAWGGEPCSLSVIFHGDLEVRGVRDALVCSLFRQLVASIVTLDSVIPLPMHSGRYLIRWTAFLNRSGFLYLSIHCLPGFLGGM